jgi:CheY-like chemotaxis protein
MEMLRTVLPDLIVTDMQMPQMDGNEFIAKLKASTRIARIPIVVLRGKSTHDTAEIDPRADASVFKDVEIVAQLEKALRQVMEERKPGDVVRAS